MKISSAWPNQLQLMLLKAALLPPEQALLHWQEFAATHNLEELDHGCNQVLPMVFINLRGRMSHDINEKICRSSYKHAWANNHLLMHDAKSLLSLLKDNEIDACLLKGAAFIALYYPDYGMRIFGDIDILISPKNMPEVINLLESSQYKIKSHQVEVDSRSLLKIMHAKSFVNHRGTDFDVHQYLSPFLIDSVFTERVWKNKRAISLFGYKNLACVLSPTHQLLHSILHGLQYAPVSSVRWIIDAGNLLRNQTVDIDWDELMDICAKHHLNLPMSQALPFLNDEFQIPIPDHVIHHFNHIPITRKDKAYYIRSSNLGLANTLGRIKRSWEHYKIYSSRNTSKPSPSGFYNFLLVYLDIKSPWLLGPYLVMKTTGVLTQSAKHYSSIFSIFRRPHE